MYVLIGVIIGTILWRIGCMFNTRMAWPEAKYRHKWRLSRHTTPSGKLLYYCPRCGLYDPAPCKAKYENRVCERGRYK